LIETNALPLCQAATITLQLMVVHCLCIVLSAFCKNPVNSKWYSYNDRTVEELNGDSAIVTNAAYLLFYRHHFPTRTDRCDVSLSRWIEAVLTATYTDLEINEPCTTKKTTKTVNGVYQLLTVFCL